MEIIYEGTCHRNSFEKCAKDAPFHFIVGTDSVIKGVDIGIQKVKIKYVTVHFVPKEAISHLDDLRRKSDVEIKPRFGIWIKFR